MIKTKIQVRGDDGKFRRVTLGGLDPKRYQMLALGNYAAALMKSRVTSGRGIDDSRMKPLRGSYLGAKVRYGLKPFRDLVGPGIKGHMLDALRCRYADDKIAIVDITTQHGREAGRANERRDPWWGLSPADLELIAVEFRKIFGMDGFGISTSTSRKGGSTPVPLWMDPLGIGANAGYVKARPMVQARARGILVHKFDRRRIF